MKRSTVRPSVPSIDRSSGGFAAERTADGRYRSIAARRACNAAVAVGAQQQMRAASR